MLETGSYIGAYRVLDVIGEGGMGVVYRALDTRLDREVALKLITGDLAGLSDYKKKLAAEAKIAARIDSDNVVRIWELAESDVGPYIAFELVPGSNLGDVMATLSFQQKIEYARQIAEGLSAAHSLGVIHRDLKPDNIKVSDSERIKILDFGLAKSVTADQVDTHGEIQGTLLYMSPEQVSGAELNLKSDMFSLGCIYYELFTGRRPFAGEYPAATVYSILHEDPLAPSEIDPSLPKWIDDLVMKLLAKTPDNRFSDMTAVVEYIRAVTAEPDVSPAVAPYRHRRKTVTVVDIKNLSGDDSWNYFCQGFTEDLLREISRRTELVISAEPSGNDSRDLSEVFRACRTDYVVSGTLMKHQANVRLSLNVYGEKGANLVYGEHFQGEEAQIFELLSKAAEGTSSALAEVTGSQPIGVEDSPYGDVTAYDFYLRGRSYYQTNKPQDLQFAVRMFNKALESDPGLALAHTGLSDVYAFQYMAYYDRSPDRIESAKQEALKALEMDPNLPEASRSLGRFYMFTGDLESAEKTFRRVVEIAPKYAIGYRTIAWLKDIQADHEEALHWAKKALQLAPTDLETLLLIGLTYLRQKKYTLALATLQRTIELGPDYGRAHYYLGVVYIKLGVFDLALESLLQSAKFQGDPNSYNDAGWVYIVLNKYDAAAEMFRKSIEADQMPFCSYYFLGMLEQLRGNPDKAREYHCRSVSLAEQFEKQDPDNCYIPSFRAAAMAACGQKEKARAIVEPNLEPCRGNGEALYFLAWCFAQLGDEAKAGEVLDMAVAGRAGPTEKEIASDPHFNGRFLLNLKRT